MAAAAAASEDQAEEEEADLGAIGFMFSNETSKAWVTHQLAPGVVVDVLCIDEDGPGALQSGHYVWPAAPFLARFIARHWGQHPALRVPPNAAARVLELGAGCGLVGLTVAQMADCASVLFSDYDHGTLKLIEAGMARNKPRLRAACRAMLLEWGREDGLRQEEGEEEEEEEEKGFDLVVGSDLIYSDSVVRPLMQTVAAVLGRRENAEARFLLCGSFALGDTIVAEVARVCIELKLSRTPVSLEGEEDAPATVWMECITIEGK